MGAGVLHHLAMKTAAYPNGMSCHPRIRSTAFVHLHINKLKKKKKEEEKKTKID